MSRIIVLGGCGYVGSALVPHLRGCGHDVDTCDITGVPTIRDDYRMLFRGRLDQYDAVILLAARSSVKAASEDPAMAFDLNVVGLHRLIEKMHPAQCLIYASSASVHAVEGDKFHNMYDFTKFAGDALVKLLRPEGSWGLRFGTVCGASPNIRLDLMINRMVWSAIVKGHVEMANPLIRRPILAMNDLCRGVAEIVAGEVPAGIHDLASFNSDVEKIAFIVSSALNCSIKEMPSTSAYDFEMEPSPWFMGLRKSSISMIVIDLLTNHKDQWLREKGDGAD